MITVKELIDILKSEPAEAKVVFVVEGARIEGEPNIYYEDDELVVEL